MEFPVCLGCGSSRWESVENYGGGSKRYELRAAGWLLVDDWLDLLETDYLCRDCGYLARLGIPKLDVEPEGRVLSTDERLALFAGARGMSQTARRNVAILAVLDDVGPRVSELVTLDREDIRLDDRSVALRHPAKRGVVRTLPLGSDSVRAIRDLTGTRRVHGPLFVQRGGARMTDDAVRSMLVRLSEETGVERVSPHDFRHTASTNYSANGADEALKNKVFGWQPDRRSMNQRYTHLTPEQIIAAHQRLSPLDHLAPFRRSRAA